MKASYMDWEAIAILAATFTNCNLRIVYINVLDQISAFGFVALSPHSAKVVLMRSSEVKFTMISTIFSLFILLLICPTSRMNTPIRRRQIENVAKMLHQTLMMISLLR